MKKPVVLALVVGMLGLGTAACAQSAKDETCNRTAKAELERCQKRIPSKDIPVDPRNPTDAEKKAIDKHEKAWKACTERAQKRSAACRL